MTDPTLWVEPAARIYVNLSWSHDRGFDVHVASYALHEQVGSAEDSLSRPRERYERLTLSEALDVIDAEVRRRRCF